MTYPARGLFDCRLYVSPDSGISWVPWDGSGSGASASTSDYHKVVAGSNNAAAVKGAAGVVYTVKGFNNAAYPVYVKLYNKASAPNPAVDVPMRTIAMQAGVRSEDDLKGLGFSVGIAIAVVKGISDTDNTAVLANDAVVDIEYV